MKSLKNIINETVESEILPNLMKLRRILDDNGYKVLSTHYTSIGGEMKIRMIDGRYYKLIIKQFR